MFCKACGREIDNSANVCPYCGTAQNGPDGYMQQQNQMNYNYNANYGNPQQNGTVDNGNFGWSILGCCFPIVGLILFLVWKNDKPTSAKQAGIGGLIGFIIGILFYVLTFLIGMIGSAGMYY